MTDFPRGWTLQSTSPFPNTASITVPGVPGIVHVLDSFFAQTLNFGTGAAANQSPGVNIGAGRYTYGVCSTPANTVASAEVSLSALELATPPGGPLIVEFGNSTPASYGQFLVIQGHDI